jgi:hypothetical protein
MAVVTGEPAPARESGTAPEALRAFARLLGGIASIGSVRRVSLATDGGSVHLWALLRAESPDDEERIFLLEHDYFAAGGAFPLELHVVPLDKVDERNLPPAETLFER